MKRIIKKPTVVFSLFLVVMLSMVMLAPSTAYAANNFPYPLGGKSLSIDNKAWYTIATSTTGFNCDVSISVLNSAPARTDVRMLGKNGNVVWTGKGWLAVNETRIFECGSDVYEIQLSTQGGSATANAWYAGPLGSHR